MAITHAFLFIFRDEPGCRPKLTQSRPRPGSCSPSSLKKFLWRSGRPGRKVTSIHLLPPFFLLTLFHLVTHFNYTNNYVSELFEEVDLDTFLKEDQATLTRGGKESVAHVVRDLRDYLQHECGEGEALPDNVFRDVMLQVHVHTFSLDILITNPLFNPCLTRICIIQLL